MPMFEASKTVSAVISSIQKPLKEKKQFENDLFSYEFFLCQFTLFTLVSKSL